MLYLLNSDYPLAMYLGAFHYLPLSQFSQRNPINFSAAINNGLFFLRSLLI